MALDTKLTLSLLALLTGVADLESPKSRIDRRHVVELESGTGAGRADRVFSDHRSIAASSSESLDLAGTLETALGSTAAMARVKIMIIMAAAANVNNVLVGGAESAGWLGPFADVSDKLVVRPGAGIALWAGPADATAYPVTATTADLLQVANSGSGSAVEYDIYLIGASA
ncbi:hypothetical protein Aple_010760 [Acrocarpospora pleiomorpha]|uniref:Uncharacterized protein n=1 Tax=Acrocarpospora pleiomorpha TaxID=90975 RepID=A0A5M3XF19_9ACTN|nr:hypothetical protein [Acrocarpospora pleiomorpha]GES18181.1 hypothetical protein Aple_010760 [Acrocarpospora pleiomorpha]